MSENNPISNNSGPGSAAEPSMEEILASIRRILKEDESSRAPAEAPEDEVLVLNAAMVAAPADISTATQLPVDTGLIAAHEGAPVTTYHEPMHFASEPEIETQLAPAAEAPFVPAAETRFAPTAETPFVAAAETPFVPTAETPFVPTAETPFVPTAETPFVPPGDAPFAPKDPPAPAGLEPPAPEMPQTATPAVAQAPNPERIMPMHEPEISQPAQPQEHKLDEPTQHDLQSPDGLVGNAAHEAVANSIGALVRSISTERAISVSRGGVTIEDIVREEIKPVLKAWLDTHLPSLVERIVRSEIERVIDRSQV